MNYLGPSDSVPFFSQLDSSISQVWQEKTCGIVSLYIVMSYFWQQASKKQAPSLNEIVVDGLDSDSYLKGIGWDHVGLAGIARSHGFKAVVRSWFIRDDDLKIMNNQGRISSKKEEKLYIQTVQSEFIKTLTSSLENMQPVILSVKPKFSSNGSNHLVVITAISDDGSSLKVHDPIVEDSSGNQEVSMAKLLQYCNYNAIFISK